MNELTTSLRIKDKKTRRIQTQNGEKVGLCLEFKIRLIKLLRIRLEVNLI